MAIEIKNTMSGDEFKAEVEKAVDKTGDTITGDLLLEKEITDETPDNAVVPKSYVDKCVKIINQSISFADNEIPFNGMKKIGTITGCDLNNYQIFIKRQLISGVYNSVINYMVELPLNEVIGYSEISYLCSDGDTEYSQCYIKIDSNGDIYLGANKKKEDYKHHSFTSKATTINFNLILLPAEEIVLNKIVE